MIKVALNWIYRNISEMWYIVNLESKFTLSNDIGIITSEDLSKHNIAEDCMQWQDAHRGFADAIKRNDMIQPFLVPDQFNLDKSSMVSSSFANVIEDFKSTPLTLTQLGFRNAS